MKKTLLSLMLLLAAAVVPAQQTYWVFLADKAGSTFDPYTYFDAKAIERYQQCGADLYDISNYPVSAAYEQGVGALATEAIGASRWMNAVGVVATPAQVAAIEALPYVLRVQPIEGNMQLAEADGEASIISIEEVDGPLEAQLVRMGGQTFRAKGIDGKGIRIAVFDGGFPRVNTHDVFRHLRDNHQILRTWNFPNNKEDVYGWNSHGTMTLSCIAGRIDGKDLGLATGAEFLLARTEVNAEPFKEEVWWQMAVEWADRNGANIISSSLGYGKERHYTTDMDGTSYVAKAANLAARKGMLVCNSAGNEADDSQWKTIITPSDADSVLCVGGIENSLREYNHISFSSYGPSADGRQKPNVCAFGYARTANIPNDHATHYVHGTSFSCPLVAGFAACAWQASPGKTAMELFRMIEQSADLYPYCDYAFGYGVPQAAYFVGERKSADPTFRFVEEGDMVRVTPLKTLFHKPVFYKEVRPDGSIVRYGKKTFTVFDTLSSLCFPLAQGNRLVVHIEGYTASFTAERDLDSPRPWAALLVKSHEGGIHGDVVSIEYYDEHRLVPSDFGSNAKHRFNLYFGLGLPVKTAGAEMAPNVWSPDWSFGVRMLRAFSKSYCIGLSLGADFTRHRYNGLPVNDLEASLGITQAALDGYDKISTRRLGLNELNLELFQRVRLVPLGLMGNGLHWDLGFYIGTCYYRYTLEGKQTDPAGANTLRTRARYAYPDAADSYNWNFGVTTRLTYDWIGLTVRYRLNGLGKAPAAGQVLLPRLTLGLQLQY